MKALVLGFLLVSSAAMAGGFDIDKDGVSYRCEVKEDTGASAGTCSAKAYQGPFSKDESIQLCAGARSDAPADCALKIYAGPFSKDEAMKLCKGARTIGPAECVLKIYSGPFSKDEALSLCQRGGDAARAKCVLSAYSGPYSKDEAIKLCAGPHAVLVLRSLELIGSSPELQSKMAALKQKTVQAVRN